MAKAYVTMLEQLDLTDVAVIGNSFGGWPAAEIALQESPRGGGVVTNGLCIRPMKLQQVVMDAEGAAGLTVALKPTLAVRTTPRWPAGRPDDHQGRPNSPKR